MEITRLFDAVQGRKLTTFGAFYLLGVVRLLNQKILSQIQQLSGAAHRLTTVHDKNGTLVTSTLTITGARARDTGTYGCFLPLFPQLQVEQYVYVYSMRLSAQIICRID